MRRFLIGVLALTSLLVSLTACTTVQPWQRDILAKESMSPDYDAVTLGYDDHVYFSKEASSGGRGFAGGGCGCN